MKQRIISAAIALLIGIPIVILGGNLYGLVLSFIGILGYNELLNAKGKENNYPFVIKFIGLSIFVLFMLHEYNFNYFIWDIKTILLLSILLSVIPIIFYTGSKTYSIDDAFFILGSGLLLGLAFNKLINIRFESLYVFIYLVSITIMTDTFAYFTGYFFGKHKLCPKVSPNKTWEGFFGGLIVGTVVSVILFILLIGNPGILKLIFLTIILSIVGQMGDLLFSSIKRHFKIKDYGNIMPGHGGVLDRLDSILIVCLTFSILSMYL